MGQYLRTLREERGMTVRDLARAVGLPESSASYISQLEAGLKVPNLELALRLAQTLHDRQGIFRLWSMTARRGNPSEVSVALRELARLLGDPSIAHDPHFTHPLRARIESAREALRSREGIRRLPGEDTLDATSQVLHEGFIPPPGVEDADMLADLDADVNEYASRMRSPFRHESLGRAFQVPLLPEGTDLGHGEFGHERAEEFVRLDLGQMRAMELNRPFAWRLSERSVQRVSSLLQPGDIAVFTRDFSRIVDHEVYAVRHPGAHMLVLSLLLWNGRELLLLPQEGRSDFEVLPATDERMLRKLIVGRVATVIRGRS
jgi:DNA-binding XRE family transcriptional regulator